MFFLTFLFSAEPPLLAQGAPLITAGIGQSLSIPCMLLDGIPLPERHWSLNGKPVRSASIKLYYMDCVCAPVTLQCFLPGQVQLNRRLFLRSDGSLYIERAIPEDAGMYVCTAVNVAGSTNITVRLEVHGKGRIKRHFASLPRYYMIHLIICFTR